MQRARVARAVDAVLDGGLAVGFSLLALVETGLRWDDGYSAGPLALNLPLLLLVTAPLAIRRRAPWLALAVAFGAVVLPSLLVAHTLFFFGGLLPLALLVYSGARYVDRRAVLVLAGPAALLAAYPLHVPDFDGPDYLFGVVLFGVAWGAGRVVRRLEVQRALLADALSAQLREQEARERALLLDERARIARELHDVVAHAVSVMVVQAGAARFALGSDEDEVRARLLSVEDTGRAAVGDLRRLLDVLRADDDEDVAPPPGLARLGDLVDGVRRAGIAVRLHVGALPGRLPAAVDAAAYRLVQEGLTNVLKHSASGTADVVVERVGNALVVGVRDGGPPREPTTAPDPLSTGHGLVGLRERVGLLGGRLEAGSEGTGWSVRAELPLARAAAEVAG